LTDTFDDACLSFRSASINPSATTSNSLSWNNLGTLNAGTSMTVRVVFDAIGTCQNTINSVTVIGDDDVGNLGISAGPATAIVSITEPLVDLSKTLLNPTTAPYYIGDTLTYELKVKNTGTTIITDLPLTDGYSISCLAYISSNLSPDGAAGGAIVWDNIGPLAVDDSIMIQVKFKILDLCTPLTNNTAITFASDENNDKVPAVMDIVIIGVTNRPPVATNDFDSTFADQDTMVIVLLNDTELDSQAIILTGVGTNASNGLTAQGGTVTINDNGTIGDTSDDFLDYTPPAGFVGSDTLFYQICDDVIPALCDTATVVIQVAPYLTTLKIRVLLQGAMIGAPDTLMRADLGTQGFIPLATPYDSSYNTTGRFTPVDGGNEVTSTAILAANTGTADAIVDWVFVELRTPNDSTDVFKTISALVQRDGDVIDATSGELLMLDNLPDSFFVAVKHRNHLGTMTAKEVLPLNSIATVDFTSMPLADYFTHPGYDTLAVTTMQGKRALWAGNTNKDAKTKYDGSVNDRIAIGFDILTDGLNNPSILNYARFNYIFYGIRI